MARVQQYCGTQQQQPALHAQANQVAANRHPCPARFCTPPLLPPALAWWLFTATVVHNGAAAATLLTGLPMVDPFRHPWISTSIRWDAQQVLSSCTNCNWACMMTSSRWQLTSPSPRPAPVLPNFNAMQRLSGAVQRNAGTAGAQAADLRAHLRHWHLSGAPCSRQQAP